MIGPASEGWPLFPGYHATNLLLHSLAGTVTSDAAGVARFEVPLHAAFSLTTVPVS